MEERKTERQKEMKVLNKINDHRLTVRFCKTKGGSRCSVRVDICSWKKGMLESRKREKIQEDDGV